MAAKKNTSSKKSTRATSSPLRIQKEINADYVELGRDYKKLGMALMRKPATKYVLGGIAISVFGPMIFKALKNNATINSFIERPASTIVDKWSSLVSKDGSEGQNESTAG